MNRILIILLVALAAIGGYIYFAPHVEAPGDVTENRRVMNVESYVRQNISALSPGKEVLGGTFYVTEISSADGHGTVSYEDGHNAYTADFTYFADQYGVSISSFEVRD
jgi:hypothetical protein